MPLLKLSTIHYKKVQQALAVLEQAKASLFYLCNDFSLATSLVFYPWL
jgi:hypothetical protein